jgi:hypothetical protein
MLDHEVWDKIETWDAQRSNVLGFLDSVWEGMSDDDFLGGVKQVRTNSKRRLLDAGALPVRVGIRMH